MDMREALSLDDRMAFGLPGDGYYVAPQFDASGSGGEGNISSPYGQSQRVNIGENSWDAVARLALQLGVPIGSVTGGVTGTHNKTTLSMPDEYQAQGAPETVEYGNRRGFVPTNYDLSATVGPHTGTVNVQPRMNDALRDGFGGRSAWDFGYKYKPSEDESLSITATPFGRRVVKDRKTGETEMDRSIMARYATRF
jgi:hypothetical protein